MMQLRQTQDTTYNITKLSGLLNATPYPAPQIRRASRWRCVLYKFTYLLTYLQTTVECVAMPSVVAARLSRVSRNSGIIIFRHLTLNQSTPN